MANRSLIDGEKPAGIRIFDPHRLRVVLEQHPIALFRRPQRIEHAHALGHLADQQQRRLVAVIVHSARAHFQHDFDAAGAPQDRLESPPAGDGGARDAGIRPERVRAGAQHALAGHAEQIGGARVGVEDHAAARIDDDQRLRHALEQIAVAALDLAQRLLGRLLFDDPAQLGAGIGDAGEQRVVRRLGGVGKEFHRGQRLVVSDRGEGEDRRRAFLGIRPPLRRAVAEDLARQLVAVAPPAPLGQAPQDPEAIRPRQVPDDARRQLAGFMRELDAAGLPAGRGADALQRGAKRILQAARFLRGLPDGSQQLRLARPARGVRVRHLPSAAR